MRQFMAHSFLMITAKHADAVRVTLTIDTTLVLTRPAKRIEVIRANEDD